MPPADQREGRVESTPTVAQVLSLLITRLKQRYAWESPASAISALVLLEFGDFAMIRHVLKGIKARAENWQR
jgi:hypothetical protein